MKPEDEAKIRAIFEETQQEMERATEDYWGSVIQYLSLKLEPEAISEITNQQEMTKKAYERVKPLLPIIGKLQASPNECVEYEIAANNILLASILHPNLSDNDLKTAFVIIFNIHKPLCPNPDIIHNLTQS